MWRFYWVLICGIPKALWNAVDLTVSVSAAVVFLLMLFNRRLGERLLMSWHAISPWWSLVPVAMIVIYGLMRSNYEHYCHLETSLNQSILELRQENSTLKAEVFDLRNPKISPDEERRRQIVLERIKRLKRCEKEMLRYIMDCGTINWIALIDGKRFSPSDVQGAIASGSLFSTQLLIASGNDWSVKDEFRSALDYVLSSESL